MMKHIPMTFYAARGFARIVGFLGFAAAFAASCLLLSGDAYAHDKKRGGRIADAVYALFVATDEKDWARVREVFADEVDFDVTSLAGGEPATLPADDIVAGWREGLKDVPFVHHQIGNMTITKTGKNTAKVFCYGMATHHNPDAEKRTTWFVGSYDIQLSRTDDKWKITAFRFNKKYVD